jgi:alpha-tubulin suppressor-like RCC1 family protein
MRSQIQAVLSVLLMCTVTGCDDAAESPAEPTRDASAAMASVAEAPAFYQLASGGFHTCGIATDGAAWCWGTGSSGQLGEGTNHSTTMPVPVTGGLTFRGISTDNDYTCGVTTDYQAYCWGDNTSGQLGDGTRQSRSVPTPVTGGLRFYQVNAGRLHTCGVSYPDRKGYCWGLNADGQLGDGSRTSHIAPVPIASGLQFRHISAGSHHTCGVTTSDRAYCWGSDQFGQIGDGSEVTNRTRPTAVAGGYGFRQLEVGSTHTCAVTPGRKAYCWGYGQRGQIGDGKTLLRFTPRAVAGGLSFARVALGSDFTCAETQAGTVYCWGSNEDGQVGDGTTIRRLRPVPLAGDLRFGQVGAGGWNACGKTTDAVGYCWGQNVNGQLGDGTVENRSEPVLIAGGGAGVRRAVPATSARARWLADSLASPN